MNATGPVTVGELLELLEGQVTEGRAAEIRSKLDTCAVTRQRMDEAKRLLNLLRQEDPRLEHVDLVAAVHRGLVLPPRRRGVHRAVAWAGGALAAAAVVLLGLSLQRGLPAEDGFTAKGSHVSVPPDSWVALAVFAASENAAPHPVEGEVHQNDRLMFAYTNLGPQPADHLMVVGVDASGQVYRYYPASQGDGAPARSIAIRRDVSREELPDGIRHALPLGPLVVFALFTQTPLNITDVEQNIQKLVERHQWDVKRPPRLVAGAAQSVVVLNVVP